MKIRRKKAYLVTMVTVLILFTGCWDRVEIENRGFVLGIGLDKAESEGKIAMTYQFALPSAMFGAGGNGGGGGEKVWNVTSTSPSVIRAEKQILTRMNRVPDLQHTQVLIIGEALAEEGLYEYIDFFLREINIRRRMDVLIAEGKAEDLFDIAPLTANSTADYLSEIIMLNEKDVHRISSEVDLLKMSKNLRRGTDFIVAKVAPGKKDIEMTGAGVFRKDQLIGYLDPEEVRKTKWLIDDISQGTIVVEDIGGIQGHIVFEISEGKTRVTPQIHDESVDFDAVIRVEGDVAELEDLDFPDTTSEEFITEVERKIEQEIKKECEEIMKKAQEEFEAEFFNFGALVKNYDRRWFEKHEAEWRKIFKKSRLSVKVNVDIRRVGLVD